MSLKAIEFLAVWFLTALEFILIGRLAQLRLLSERPWFTLFIAWDALRVVLLYSFASLDYHRHHYATLWALTAPLTWLTLCCAVVEVFHSIHAQFQGENSRETLLKYLLALGLAVPLIASWIIDSHLNVIDPFVDAIRVGNRCIFAICSAVLLGQAAFFSLARLPLPTNLRVHRFAFTCFVTADALVHFLTGTRSTLVADLANLISTTIMSACLVAWLVILRSDGEISPPQPPITREDIVSRARRFEQSRMVMKGLLKR